MTAQAVTFATLAPRSADGYSATLDLQDASTLRLLLAITANSAQPAPSIANTLNADSPSFNLKIESSPDGATFWREVECVQRGQPRDPVRFTPGSYIRNERHVFVGFDRYVRAHWMIGRGAPVTFSLDGFSV